MEPTSSKITGIDTDMQMARQTASQMLVLLDRFIPSACREEAYYAIVEACIKGGYELTSKLMRKEYEAWKLLQINDLGLSFPFSKPES